MAIDRTGRTPTHPHEGPQRSGGRRERGFLASRGMRGLWVPQGKKGALPPLRTRRARRSRPVQIGPSRGRGWSGPCKRMQGEAAPAPAPTAATRTACPRTTAQLALPLVRSVSAIPEDAPDRRLEPTLAATSSGAFRSAPPDRAAASLVTAIEQIPAPARSSPIPSRPVAHPFPRRIAPRNPTLRHEGAAIHRPLARVRDRARQGGSGAAASSGAEEPDPKGGAQNEFA